MSDVLLEMRGLVKSFGGNRAVDGCTFSVRRTSMTGVTGPNGAGKSTLFNIISGLLRADQGEILFDSASIGGL